MGLLSKIFGMFSEDIGIDLGTSNTLICVKNKGIVLNAPSVIVVNNKTKTIINVGEKAKQMIGRTPTHVVATRPLKNGVIADFELTIEMLKAFYKEIKINSVLTAPRVIICVPAGVTQVEKRSVMDVTKEAGAREVYLVEEPMAAAIGAGLNVFDPEGNMIVDLGGGTAEIGVTSLGGIVKTASVKLAGDRFDSSIIEYVKEKHGLYIGEKTAEEIKINVGAVSQLEEELYIEVSGRNVMTGLPKNVIVYSSEIEDALNEDINEIIEEIRSVLERIPPEISADIKRKGIYLGGGGALLRGLDKRISESLNLEVFVAEEPLDVVINGIQKLLTNFDEYKKVLVTLASDY